jgi:hypothetical protein
MLWVHHPGPQRSRDISGQDRGNRNEIRSLIDRVGSRVGVTVGRDLVAALEEQMGKRAGRRLP